MKRNRTLDPAFDGETAFEVAPLNAHLFEAEFNRLKDGLVDETLGANETLSLQEPLRQAANEAAGLAWTTAFPLLVFPALFEEKARLARLQQDRARRVLARSEELMMGAVL